MCEPYDYQTLTHFVGFESDHSMNTREQIQLILAWIFW